VTDATPPTTASQRRVPTATGSDHGAHHRGVPIASRGMQVDPNRNAADDGAPTRTRPVIGGRGYLRGPVRHRIASRLIGKGWDWLVVHGAAGPSDERTKRFGSFGEGSCLSFPPGAVFGERWIHVGRHTLIGPFASISAGMLPGQTMVTDPVVRIGDRCMIGRGSHIVGHFSIDIEDDVHTGPYVYITDQNHGYEDPTRVVHEQWPSDKPVRIGAGSWLGTGVVVLPGSQLGRNVVVAAGAVVRGSFPDHSVIAGVPARVVRHYADGQGWLSGSAERSAADQPGDAPAVPTASGGWGSLPASPA
jgi:serine acetyltransferase